MPLSEQMRRNELTKFHECYLPARNEKPTFGSLSLANNLEKITDLEEIEIVGLCTVIRAITEHCF